MVYPKISRNEYQLKVFHNFRRIVLLLLQCIETSSVPWEPSKKICFSVIIRVTFTVFSNPCGVPFRVIFMFGSSGAKSGPYSDWGSVATSTLFSYSEIISSVSDNLIVSKFFSNTPNAIITISGGRSKNFSFHCQ